MSSSNKDNAGAFEVVEVEAGEHRWKALRFTICRAATLETERLHAEHQRKPFGVFITLTYRPEVEWAPGHIRRYVDTLQAWCRREFGHLCPVLWVLEMTKAGKPHYHLLVLCPRACCIPKPDERGWWAHGMSNIQRARFGPGYIAKYASKGSVRGEASPPEGARLYGLSGLSKVTRDALRFDKSPSWLKAAGATPAHDVHRFSGGGWVARTTGELARSPWRFQGRVNGKVRLALVAPIPSLGTV